MTQTGMKYRDERAVIRNRYLQATVTVKEHVKTLANMPPRNHLKRQRLLRVSNPSMHSQHMRGAFTLTVDFRQVLDFQM